MRASRRPVHFVFRRLELTIAVLLAPLLGAVTGLLARESLAHFSHQTHQSPWMYKANDCADPLDPINVVFYGTDASAEQVQRHADHHGPSPMDSHGTIGSAVHYFKDHDGCEPMDAESASNNGFTVGDFPGLPLPRYHMRYNEGDIGDVLDFDNVLDGYYSLAAAHHEDVDICWKDIPGPIDIPYPAHVLDAGSPGGYNMGRNHVEDLWVDQGDHYSPSLTEYWGNIDPKRQCNGNWVASDGYVRYIQIAKQGGSVAGKAFLGF